MNGLPLALGVAAGLAAMGLTRRGSRTTLGARIALLRKHGAKVVRAQNLDSPTRKALMAFFEGVDGAYLVGHLPAAVIQVKVLQLEDPWPTFEAYHRWYLLRNTTPHHSETGRWPSIVNEDERGEFLIDGWHRFHSYVRDGATSFPVVLPISEAEALTLEGSPNHGLRRGSPNAREQALGLSEPLQQLLQQIDLSLDEQAEELAYHDTTLLWNSLEDAGEHKLANAYEASEYDTHAILTKIRKTKRLGAAWLRTQIPVWTRNTLQDDPAGAPSFLFFDRPKIIKNTWMIHFTDHAPRVVRQGFLRGLDDPRRLGLTTYFTDRAKNQPGYVFAYLPEDVSRYAFRKHQRGETKYGQEAVLFRADAVVAFHHNDEEPQAISWGPEARHLRHVTIEHDAGRQVCVEHPLGAPVRCYANAVELVKNMESR